MAKLPDLEGLAIFAKVAELRSFAMAAMDLELSKATVSKAIARLEKKLGARLFNRTSRRLALTDAGQLLLDRAGRILAEGEAAESEAHAQSATPRGLVRLAVPMSFGLKEVAPLMPEFLAKYLEVSVDLHLSDAVVDLIGEGFDAALRIAALPDSSLRARRLREVSRYLVAAPAYLKRHGRPFHPRDLMGHACLCYAYLPTPDVWRFVNTVGEEVRVRPSGPLRANNADALAPALLAGLGLAVQPDFVVGESIANGRLEAVMLDWSPPPIALHLVMPPGGPRPARVEALAAFLTERLGRQN
ncbi:MAG TPA: LysR family transcriptional regulator [Methyloceanibacter sp.]|jgi:DNA-binding transcriptional LysR family regulator|nr:LysR family transcriptional regulator [Methyloceanibacter sp.]